MIFNENGIIINADYILDNIINESMSDIVNKVSQSAIKLLRKIADTVMNFIDLLKGKKYGDMIKSIKTNQDEFLKNINLDSGYITVDTELFKYLSSDGYGDWIYNFKSACDELKSNNDLSVEELRYILYSKDDTLYDKDNWFKVKTNNLKNTKLSDKKSEFAEYLKNYDNNLNYLRTAYSEIKVINGVIIKKPIKTEVINELHYYCIHAISAYKNLTDIIFNLFDRNKRNNESSDDFTQNIKK